MRPKSDRYTFRPVTGFEWMAVQHGLDVGYVSKMLDLRGQVVFHAIVRGHKHVARSRTAAIEGARRLADEHERSSPAEDAEVR